MADGTTGLLAPSGDDEALADAVERMLDDETMRTQMATAGQERAERIFSEREMHACYGGLYLDMRSRGNLTDNCQPGGIQGSDGVQR